MSQGKGQAHRQAAWLESAQGRGVMACLLWPLSLLYGALMTLRSAFYAHGVLKVHRLGVPVIVVGNVVVGGAGKTPCTMALVTHLQSRGWRPGVISRGHGRRGGAVAHVQQDTPARDVGDEPLLIHRRTGVPVCVARRRVDAAHALLAAHPDVDLLICDDGLQHLALGRDLAVAVFDDRGVGNGWLLPAGLLREPWPGHRGSLSRPDLVLRQRREGQVAPDLPLPPDVPMFEAVRQLASHTIDPAGKRGELSALLGHPLTAVAGVARPDVFFEMLREQGLSLDRAVALPDHADSPEYETLISAMPATTLVCTEKDAVKLFALLPPDTLIRAFAVPLELSPAPAFFEAVDSRLARLSSRHGHQTA